MLIDIKPNPKKAYALLHAGILALAAVEANGIRIDTDYIEVASERVSVEIKALEEKIYQTKEWAVWTKRFGRNSNLDSNEELAAVLWDELGYECPAYTDSGSQKTDEAALSTVGTPFVEMVLERSKLEKARGTYLTGLKKHLTPAGYIHPVFNLHLTVTYRSSSDSPNFQNQPVRNPKIMKIIRSAFIPRPGHVIVEHDYSGVEVRVAACYHQDPVMLEYIKDSTKDMHRDMAAQIYFLTPEWIKKNGKGIRNVAKNKFVFPEFYGSCWFQVAKDLWEEIGKYKLEGPDGDSLYEHLKRNGITELGERPGKDSSDKKPKKGTFMRHIYDVEDDFWNNRFKTYGKWRNLWWQNFQETGECHSLTGFTYAGNLARNDVINYAVQGSAFHCLLWTVTKVNQILTERGMKTKIIGQIHDSCVADVAIDELDEYMRIVRQVMTVDVMKQFPWLIVPLASECDICAPNASWGDKKAVEFTTDNKYVIEYEWKDKTKTKHSFDNAISFTEFLRESHHKDTRAPLRRKKLKPLAA